MQHGKADTQTRRRGGASVGSHGRAVDALPMLGEGSRGEGSARLSIDSGNGHGLGAWLGMDWMSKAAREGIGGVRLG